MIILLFCSLTHYSPFFPFYTPWICLMFENWGSIFFNLYNMRYWHLDKLRRYIKWLFTKKRKKKENPLVERSFRKGGAQWNHTIWHNNNFVECSSTEVRQQSSPILSKFFKQLFIRLLNEVLKCSWKNAYGGFHLFQIASLQIN